jgi:hypothetical protein
MARRDRRRRSEEWSSQATADALTASGALVTAGESIPARQASWQDDAWAYFLSVPELYYVANFYGDLLARGHLTVEVRLPDGSWAPGIDEVGNEVTGAAGLARDALADLGSEDRLLRAVGISDMVVGESYLDGVYNQPGWRFLSTREIKWQGGWLLKDPGGGGGTTELDPEQSVTRIWRPDPSMPTHAISPVRPLLNVLAQMRAMEDAITAAGLSRALMGLLRFPEEFQSPMPIGATPGTTTAQLFQQNLVDVINLAIQQGMTASRFAPFVVPVPSEMPEAALKLIPISAGLDGLPAGEMLEAAVNRFARGIPLPVEITLGMQRTTFANGEAIARSLKRDHLEPALERITDDLTSGYLAPIITAATLDTSTVRYGFTVEDIHSPDVVALATAAATLVKAGWDPAQSLETVGLPPMEHTGVVTPDVAAPASDRPVV